MDKKELDELYFAGMELFDAGDEEGALRLFRQGAGLGHDDAMNMVALAYDAGNVVERDKEMAIRWFKKSWRRGRQIYVCSSIARTYGELGRRREALYWWNKAVKGGDISAGLGLAQFLLGNREGRPTARIIVLVQAAANAEARTEVSFDEKEEAQELLEKLAARSVVKSFAS